MASQSALGASIKISGLLLVIALSMRAAGMLQAMAASGIDNETRRSYAIAAGPLGQKLALFAATAGISIVYEPEAVRNKCSPGLEGNFPLTEAFSRLLKDTGLESVEQADQGYLLRSSSLNKTW